MPIIVIEKEIINDQRILKGPYIKTDKTFPVIPEAPSR
jgi:hypothetical protein